MTRHHARTLVSLLATAFASRAYVANAQTPSTAPQPSEAAPPPAAAEAAPPSAAAEAAPPSAAAEAAPPPAAAEAAPPAKADDALKIYGKAYIHYDYNLSDGADGANGFDLKRVYLRLDWRPIERFRFHYTLEGGEIRAKVEDKPQRLDVTTKAFYVEVSDILYSGGWLKVGQLGLPWVPYAEGIWGFRSQSKVLADRWGYLTSTDLGVALGGPLGAIGEWQFDLVNGEGWKSPETGKHKDVHLRVTLRPLGASPTWTRNLFVTAFASEGRYEVDGPDTKRRLIGQVGYFDKKAGALAASIMLARDPADALVGKHPSLMARSGEESDALGVGVIGVLRLQALTGDPMLSRFALVGRLDYVDPDGEIDDNQLMLIIAGVDVTWNKHLHTMLAFDSTDYADNAGKSDEQHLMLVTEAKF